MKIQLSRLHFGLSKQASKLSSRFIWISLSILAIAIIIIPWLGVWIPCLSGLSKFWVDILSPVSFRDIPYKPDKTGEFSWYSSIAYSIGVIVISGVLIAIITNYLRNMGDKYLSGTLDHYAWNGHVLFLGFDELMGATLREVCKEDGEVVVAVSGDVEPVRSRIARLLDDCPDSKVEVIKCNYTDKKDLARKACVANALKLFIIGQPDDPTHDASNLKSLDTIAEILGEDTDIDAYINRSIGHFAG